MTTRQRQRGSKTRARQDAITLLKRDHRTVRELLGQLDETTTRALKKREELLAKIAQEVEIHAAIEEEIFYPAFRNKGSTHEDEKLFFEAEEEHKLVHTALPELRGTDPSSELFSARAKVLKDLIEHHAEEEEESLLPRARELMSREELESLGEKLEERKRELLEQGFVGHEGSRASRYPPAPASAPIRRGNGWAVN